MTDRPGKFIEDWHSAVQERSLEKVNALLAEDVNLISPVAFKQDTDRSYEIILIDDGSTDSRGKSTGRRLKESI